MVVIFSFSVSGLVTQICSQYENKVELYFEKKYLNLLIYIRLYSLHRKEASGEIPD